MSQQVDAERRLFAEDSIQEAREILDVRALFRSDWVGGV